MIGWIIAIATIIAIAVQLFTVNHWLPIIATGVGGIIAFVLNIFMEFDGLVSAYLEHRDVRAERRRSEKPPMPQNAPRPYAADEPRPGTGPPRGRRGFFRDADDEFSFGRLILVVVIIAIIGLSLLQSTVIVPAGNRGVLITLGKVTGVLGEGLSFKVPWITGVELVDVRVRAAERTKESAGTKDLQEVTADITVNYRLYADRVDVIYITLGRGYESSVILPNTDEALKATTAQFTAEELITRREAVKAMLRDNLQARLDDYNIEVLAVSFTDFQFSEQFTLAIEAKVTAQQKALEAQNKLEEVRFEEQQKVIKAAAEANATITRATAEAQAQLISAQATAEAIRLIQEQIAANPEYLQYLAILTWNGQLPYFLGSDMIPFLQIPMNFTQPP